MVWTLLLFSCPRSGSRRQLDGCFQRQAKGGGTGNDRSSSTQCIYAAFAVSGTRGDQVSLRQKSVELDSFRTLLNHVLPLKLKADGMLVHLAGELYQMPCEQITFTASGDLLMHAGLRPPQRFCGTGYTDGVRSMPDFSARIWLLESN